MGVAEYQEVVDHLLEGIRLRPGLLLDPLVERMHRLADRQRYEEAAWARDRHNALARALETRRIWQALAGGGVIELETPDRVRVVIANGRYSHSTASPGAQLLAVPDPGTEIPPSVQVAEEAEIIWKWINKTSVRLVEASGAFATSAHRLDRLLSPRAA
jgi:hypothetical protein